MKQVLIVLQVIAGNDVYGHYVGHTFEPTILAKYVRIRPTAYTSTYSLKFELYGYPEAPGKCSLS